MSACAGLARWLRFRARNKGILRCHERIPKTANPPRVNATGCLRHRRSWLPCPLLTLSARANARRLKITLRAVVVLARAVAFDRRAGGVHIAIAEGS